MLVWAEKVWHEMWLALSLALVFAVIVGIVADTMRIGSHIRGRLRRIKNKRAERSVENLRQRIKELNEQRDRLASYISSDRAFFLMLFRMIIVLITLLAISACCFVVSQLQSERMRLFLSPDHWLGICLYGLALTVLVGFSAKRFSGLDRKEKFEVEIAKVEGETAKLEAKLASRTRSS
jgi:hypothetical protein